MSNERIAEELAKCSTDGVRHVPDDAYRSLLLALQEAREEIARLRAALAGAECNCVRRYKCEQCGHWSRIGGDATRTVSDRCWCPDGRLVVGALTVCARCAALAEPHADIEAAREHAITPAEHDAQVRSFAYGNTSMADSEVTREDVDKAADTLRREAGDGD